MSRLVAYTFGLGLVVAVASPGLRAGTPDSYPLSTYPMFAARRSNPRLYVAEGVTARGARLRLDPELMATDEVMQAAALVRRAVAAGDARMRPLCTDIARRAAAVPELAELARVELTSAEYEPISYFVSARESANRTVHFQCAVPGKA
jgi:hypothetical protein